MCSGHTQSWAAQPDFLTPCCTNGQPNGRLYGANPILPSTYKFLQQFFSEVSTVFTDDYLHVGGDELNFACWQSNPNISAWMRASHMAGNYSALQNYYEERLLQVVDSLGRSPIVWEDPWRNGVRNFTADTAINIWIDPTFAIAGPITAAGLHVVLSSPWYINRNLVPGDVVQSWQTYYLVEPTNFNGTAAQKRRVLGGSATFWGEYIDGTNLLSTAFVHAGAVAERLWSPQNVNDVDTAAPRLAELQCRLIRRGIPAEPIDPSFCPQEYVFAYHPPWDGW